MLTKKMTGRLGNQMFQYAGMRAIQLRLYPDEQINLDFSDLKRYGREEDGFCNQLRHFNIDERQLVLNKKAKLSIYQMIMLCEYYLKRKIIKFFSSSLSYEWKKKDYESSIQQRYNKQGLYLYSYGFFKFKKADVKNKYFMGFFESAKYFDEIRGRLLKEFEPKYPPIKSNEELYKAITQSESVCVTIRRGDFLKSKFASAANVCNKDYFERSISVAKRKIKNPKFFVFSDDIEWAKKNIDFPPGTMFESGNDPVWEKLRLMYSCKHFIISNSTFSWWAQYLSRNERKVVIAPSKWRIEGYDGRELYDSCWTIIEL